MNRLKSLILATTLFLFSVCDTVLIAQPKEGWKAGVASVKITPSQPLWMAGYASRTHPSTGKITDIWAKALALEDKGGNRSVLVTMDLVGIPKGVSDQIRNVLKGKLGLSRSQIILNTAHNHSGPVLTGALADIYPYGPVEQHKIDDYTRSFSGKVIHLVEEAFHRLEPVTLYSGNGVARFQVNRRNNKEATLSLQTHLIGPNDYAVPVIKVIDRTGNLMAVAFGYACHNTTLSGYKWSGDYAGFAQISLEKRFRGTTALFFQGCGADQNPLPRRSVALAKQYGNELADAVARVLTGKMRPLSPVLKTAYKEIDLPLNPPPTSKALRKKIKNSAGYQKRWASGLLRKLEQGDSLRTSYPYPVEVWKLGEQGVVILGGEVVIDYVIELKYIFGQNLFVLGYSNDVMSYIPTPKILREGGYEGAAAPMVYGLPATWRADGMSKIFQTILQLADKVDIPIPASKVE